MKKVINHWERLHSFPENILHLASSTIQMQLAFLHAHLDLASASFIYLFRISQAVDGKQCDTMEEHWNALLKVLVSFTGLNSVQFWQLTALKDLKGCLPVRFLVKGPLISTMTFCFFCNWHLQLYLLENRKILHIIWVIVCGNKTCCGVTTLQDEVPVLSFISS